MPRHEPRHGGRSRARDPQTKKWKDTKQTVRESMCSSNQELCDLVLLVPPAGSFRVHRCVVMARSPMIRSEGRIYLSASRRPASTGFGKLVPTTRDDANLGQQKMLVHQSCFLHLKQSKRLRCVRPPPLPPSGELTFHRN